MDTLVKAEIHFRSHSDACGSFQALNWKEKHLYLVINMWSLRSDLLGFATHYNIVEYFYCEGVKPIVEVSSCHCCLNSNAFISQHQCIELPQLTVNYCLHEMFISRFQRKILFLTRFIGLKMNSFDKKK